MNKKKLINKSDEDEFIEEVLNSVKVKGMTIRDTKEAMQKVYKFMEDNAQLENLIISNSKRIKIGISSQPLFIDITKINLNHLT